MCSKRVFKTKTFDRWAGGVVTDTALCASADEIERGIWEADPGGGVCKKRVAVAGQGKSSSTRVLVAKKSAIAVVYIVGKKKSTPGSDFSDVEVAVTKAIAKSFHGMTSAQFDHLVAKGELKEICDDEGCGG
ncbi:hypothetical protein JOD97_006209 [Duganella sp. 1411]|nr:type II toxin-antitoxin system RelE/ParE family toxin [Duganella sp. 1411]MBP1208122.1 hypothetical protein [Duganella sp. 1411]